ncbi:hypothetical protein [uncultured Flavobacterium sp.]|uniref:hypothetical protein n=1 Tax=uncultured Flavobacterium sp. TaxID=165435 RepID=UPI002597DFA7|nr:hypothetical protein [uncultured Flavobacterium sp.]
MGLSKEEQREQQRIKNAGKSVSLGIPPKKKYDSSEGKKKGKRKSFIRNAKRLYG